MQLLLTPQIIKHLQHELRRAGSREIGGLLMGEYLGEEVFRVAEVSVQRTGGSHSCFVRNPTAHKDQLEKFFARTGNDYARFNYLGEWHSHPSFEPMPSPIDLQTMQSIVDDPNAGANFLVLLIPRLNGRRDIEMTATAFRAGTRPLAVPILAEPHPQNRGGRRVSRWLRKILGGRE